MQHLVGEGEVCDALLIDGWPEVLVVSTREAAVSSISIILNGSRRMYVRSDTMVRIEHTGHTVEAVSIEFILFHPEAQITQKETQHLVASIIEQTAVPELMTALRTAMEVEVICSIKLIESINDVLGRMAVNHIEQHNQPHTVSCINKLLQILW